MKRFACFILTLFFMLSGCRYVSDKNNSSSEDVPAMSDVAYSSQMMQSVPSSSMSAVNSSEWNSSDHMQSQPVSSDNTASKATISKDTASKDIVPVSYTHLDVYKRQV